MSYCPEKKSINEEYQYRRIGSTIEIQVLIHSDNPFNSSPNSDISLYMPIGLKKHSDCSKDEFLHFDQFISEPFCGNMISYWLRKISIRTIVDGWITASQCLSSNETVLFQYEDKIIDTHAMRSGGEYECKITVPVSGYYTLYKYYDLNEKLQLRSKGKLIFRRDGEL